MARKKMSVECKNWIILVAVFGFSIAGTTCLVWTCLDFSKISALKEEIHFNLISTSATIGGFLFTGISILISALGNKSIERMWNQDYLNNVYRAATIGIAANVVTILAALAVLLLKIGDKLRFILVRIEIITILISVIFFIWSVLDMVFILSQMKSKNTN